MSREDGTEVFYDAEPTKVIRQFPISQHRVGIPGATPGMPIYTRYTLTTNSWPTTYTAGGSFNMHLTVPVEVVEPGRHRKPVPPPPTRIDRFLNWIDGDWVTRIIWLAIFASTMAFVIFCILRIMDLARL